MNGIKINIIALSLLCVTACKASDGASLRDVVYANAMSESTSVVLDSATDALLGKIDTGSLANVGDIPKGFREHYKGIDHKNAFKSAFAEFGAMASAGAVATPPAVSTGIIATMRNYPKTVVVTLAAVGSAAYYGYKKFVASRTPAVATPLPVPMQPLQPVVVPVAPISAHVVVVAEPQIKRDVVRRAVGGRSARAYRSRVATMAVARKSRRVMQQRGRAKMQSKRYTPQRKTMRGGAKMQRRFR